MSGLAVLQELVLAMHLRIFVIILVLLVELNCIGKELNYYQENERRS